MTPVDHEHPTIHALRRTDVAVSILAAATLVGACAVAAFTTRHPDRQFAAENLMVLVACVAALLIMLHLLWVRCRFRFWEFVPDSPADLGIANVLLAGACICDVGMIMNRAYWLTFRLLRIHDETSGVTQLGSAYAFIDHTQWISAASLLIFVAGKAVGVSSVLRFYFPRSWPIAAATICATAWFIGYQLPDLAAGVWRG